MSDFKQISSENKERLVGLVSKVADYVKSGMNPTDALTKAASEGEYPPDYVLRAAEAYNGAAHLSHFKAAARDERGNSFPLADGYASVNEIMDKVSSAHQVVMSDDIAYVKESRSYFDKVIDDSFLFMEKKASAPSVDSLIKQASIVDSKESLGVANARLAYNQACESLASDIKAFWNKTANATEHRKAMWARELLERHGKEALDVISLATRVSGSECEKISSQRLNHFSLGIEYLDNLDSIVRAHSRANNLHEKLASLEAEHYANKIEREALLNEMCGYKKAFNPLASIEEVTTAQNPFLGISESTDSKSIQQKALESLADPAFFAQSKNIEKALLINQLLKEDEIISKHPAKDINMALQEIYSIAPTAAEYKPLMRAMLRKRLETGEQIDDFSLNQMMTMDEKMRDNTKELRIAPKLIGMEGDSRSIYG